MEEVSERLSYDSDIHLALKKEGNEIEEYDEVCQEYHSTEV